MRSDERDSPSCLGILSYALRLQREIEAKARNPSLPFWIPSCLPGMVKSYIFQRAGVGKQGSMQSERALLANIVDIIQIFIHLLRIPII